MRCHSEDEGSVGSARSLSDFSQEGLREGESQSRIVRRLPKRARLAKDEDFDQDIKAVNAAAAKASRTARAVHSESSTCANGEAPVLLAPGSSTASTADSIEVPTTPPATASLYQPLFAPVENLVKQLAASTILFGGAHLEEEGEEGDSAAQVVNDPDVDEARLPKAIASAPVHTSDGKPKASTILLAEDDHRFGDDALQVNEADEDFHPYAQFENGTRGKANR